MTADGGLLADARDKALAAERQHRSYSRHLFANRGLPLPSRRQLLEALVLSTWHDLSIMPLSDQKALTPLKSALLRFVRALLIPHRGRQEVWALTRSELFATAEMLDVEDRVCVAKLRYLSQQVQLDVTPFWALSQYSKQWQRDITIAADWLRGLCHGLDLPPLSSATWRQWEPVLHKSKSSFKAWLKRATARCILRYKVAAGLQRFRTTVDGLSPLQEATPLQAGGPLPNQQWCGPCRRAFGSSRALATHLFAVHGRVARYRWVLQGTVCRACGLEFFSPLRLAQHLRTATECVEAMIRGGLATDPAPGIGSLAARQASATDDRLEPPRPVAVPRLTPTGPQTDPDWSAYTSLIKRLVVGLTAPLPSTSEEVLASLLASLGSALAGFAKEADFFYRAFLLAEAGALDDLIPDEVTCQAWRQGLGALAATWQSQWHQVGDASQAVGALPPEEVTTAAGSYDYGETLELWPETPALARVGTDVFSMSYEEHHAAFAGDEPLPASILVHLSPDLHWAEKVGGCRDAATAVRAVAALGKLLRLLSSLAAPVARREVSVAWGAEYRCPLLGSPPFRFFTDLPASQPTGGSTEHGAGQL